MTSSVMQRVALGEKYAMHECLERYGKLVWSLARRFTRSSADAEDATQDVFLDIWRHANRYDESLGSEPGFIATIARRRLIDRLRRKSAEPVMETLPDIFESVAWVADESAYADCSFDVEQAVRAMASLKPEHRRVLELGFLHGLTHPEIADQLQMPLGTVKSCMRRGIMKVRDLLNQESVKVLAVAATSATLDGKRTRRTVEATFQFHDISNFVSSS